jgi:dipeptidase E
MSKIFLSGGGNKTDSAFLDKEFASCIKTLGALLYVPVARDDKQHVECLEWFKSVFEPIWNGEIRMLTDLSKRKGLSDIGGIYIGGGDTVKLLDKINETSFGSYLREARAHNIPIYGGSAGAIVLGKSIKTDPEISPDQNQPTNGLNMLSGYSVVCHYEAKDKDKITKLAQEIAPLIVLSEQSGTFLQGKEITSCGIKPIAIVGENSKKGTLHSAPREALATLGL